MAKSKNPRRRGKAVYIQYQTGMRNIMSYDPTVRSLIEEATEKIRRNAEGMDRQLEFMTEYEVTSARRDEKISYHGFVVAPTAYEDPYTFWHQVREKYLQRAIGR